MQWSLAERCTHRCLIDITPLHFIILFRSLSANTSSTAALSSELLSQTARHAKEVRGAVGEAMQLRQIMEKQEKKIAFLIGELKLTRAKLTKSEADLQSASTSLDRLVSDHALVAITNFHSYT